MSLDIELLNNLDLKDIAKTASTVRLVGNGVGLGGIALSYLTMYKSKSDPECQGSMGTACDIGRFIFYYFLAIFLSGLIGLPWDLVLLDSINLPEDSPKF